MQRKTYPQGCLIGSLVAGATIFVKAKMTMGGRGRVDVGHDQDTVASQTLPIDVVAMTMRS